MTKFTVCFLVTMLILQACNNSNDTSTINAADSTANAAKMDKADAIPDLKLKWPKPDWAKDIDDNMQVVLEELASYCDAPNLFHHNRLDKGILQPTL